jgi:hypothetical protein
MEWAPDSTDLWAPDSRRPDPWAPDSHGHLTLRRAIELFLAAKAAEGVSPRTSEWYRMILVRLVRALGSDRAADGIDPADLRAWLVELRTTLAPVSVAGYVRTLRVLGNWLAAEGLADAAALRGLRRPRVPHKVIKKAARIEFWSRRRLDRLRGPDLGADDALVPSEPDEVRMARPVLAALRDGRTVEGAPERLRALVERSVPPPSPHRLAASPEVSWSDEDRLTWEELIGGVPCQACGRPFLGDERSQREGESWAAYRERTAPIETEFRSRHPEHGPSWTVGGGPAHCRRCCAPHPLSPDQIRQLNRIANPPTPQAQAPEVRVRLCGTCHKPVDPDHVCQLEDLPKRLRAVVDAVIAQERERAP